MDNLTPVEYQGQRILTTSQLGESYKADTQLIVNNFNRNRDRYKEGKHYFPLEGEAKRLFIDQHQIELGSKNSKIIYLWTEKGAWLHAKSLNTDKAWEAYEMLVDDYYAIKSTAPMQNLSPQLQLLISMELKQNEMQKAITENKEAVQSIRDVVSLNTTSWRRDTATLITKMARALGGLEHISDLRKESYKLLNTRFEVCVETRLTNKRQRMALEGVRKSKLNALNHLDVIAEDKKLIEGYVAIIKDMAIRYGA